MKPGTSTTVITIVAIILILGGVWYFFFAGEAPEELVSKESADEVDPESKDLLFLLNSLQGLVVDTTFIDDPLYKSLRDLSVGIDIPSAKGRSNPFAPF